jgi:hypothetical protein
MSHSVNRLDLGRLTLAHMRIALFVILGGAFSLPLLAGPEEDLIQRYRQDNVFTTIPDGLFQQLGRDLPDKGLSVKALADAAPGGGVRSTQTGCDRSRKTWIPS